MATRLPWTARCMGGLALLAASPLLPGPIPALAIDAPLGSALYTAILLFLVVGYWFAAVKEKDESAAEQARRDAISDERFIKMEQLFAIVLAAFPTLGAEVRATIQQESA